jgi:hypothetical protein
MNYPSQIASQRCHIEDHVVEPTNRNLLPAHSARPSLYLESQLPRPGVQLQRLVWSLSVSVHTTRQPRTPSVSGSPCPSALPCLPTSPPRTLVFPAHFLIFHCFVLACLSSPSSRLCSCTIPTPPRISTTATQLS